MTTASFHFSDFPLLRARLVVHSYGDPESVRRVLKKSLAARRHLAIYHHDQFFLQVIRQFQKISASILDFSSPEDELRYEYRYGFGVDGKIPTIQVHHNNEFDQDGMLWSFIKTGEAFPIHTRRNPLIERQAHRIRQRVIDEKVEQRKQSGRTFYTPLQEKLRRNAKADALRKDTIALGMTLSSTFRKLEKEPVPDYIPPPAAPNPEKKRRVITADFSRIIYPEE